MALISSAEFAEWIAFLALEAEGEDTAPSDDELAEKVRALAAAHRE